jgi:three-Cys-motif partner protein
MSKKEKYHWEIGEPPPELNVHSLAKHEVLRAYLARYLDVLTANPSIPVLHLTLVDGFSGGGIYRHEITREPISGSPFIFLEATQSALLKINSQRKKPLVLDAHYFFIEKKRQTLDFLRHALTERGYGPLLAEEQISLLHGEFTGLADKIIHSIRQRKGAGRTIFLLDQYAYEDVPFPLLQRIFSQLPNAEVILTFAVDALTDFLTNSSKSERILANIGIPLDLEQIAATKGNSDRRPHIQAKLSPLIHKHSGAKYYTPFFITSRESNRAYWLVHLSMHATAQNEMKKLHWALENHFSHDGGAGLNMLGYDPLKDENLTGQDTFDEFRFDETARERSLNSLRRDLPSVIRKEEDGIRFQQLIEDNCNTTPADSGHFRTILGELLGNREIIVTTKDGGQRQKGSSIERTDLIKTHPQLFLFIQRK